METPKLCCDSTACECESSSLRSCRSSSTPARTNTRFPTSSNRSNDRSKPWRGRSLHFKLRPNGEVDDLKIPEKTLKSLREGVSPEAGGQGTNSEQALKDMLLQSSPPAFPLESLEPGKTWATKPAKIAIPGLGTLTLDKVFTFQGPDSEDAQVIAGWHRSEGVARAG